MNMKRAFKAAVVAVTTTAMCLTAAPNANALKTDNVHNPGNSGGVNCNGKDVECFEKVGDKVEVEYTLQFNNGVLSSDHGQTARGRAVAFPSVLEDVKLELVSVPAQGDIVVTPSGGVAVEQVNKEVPLKDATFDTGKEEWTPDATGGNVDTHVKKQADFYATRLTADELFKEVEYYREQNGQTGQVDVISSHTTSDDTSVLHNISIGSMRRDMPYDVLVFGTAPRAGITTLKLKGTVTTKSEKTYLPVRVRDVFWQCFQEGAGAGSDAEACKSLAELSWGRIESPLPEYSLEDQTVTDRVYRQHTEHGLNGAPQCSVTTDLSVSEGREVLDRIGADVTPRQSFGDKYVEEFTLKANPTVTYLVGGFGVMEDGCDQAGILVQKCDFTLEKQPDGSVIVIFNINNVTNVSIKESGYKTEQRPDGTWIITTTDGKPVTGNVTLNYNVGGKQYSKVINITTNNNSTLSSGNQLSSGKGQAGEGSSVDGKCIASIVGLTAPLLLLIPLGILSQVQIPGFEHVHVQLNEAMRAINDEAQRTFGIHDADRSRRANSLAEQAQAAAAQAGPMIGAAAGALGAVAVALTLGDLAMRACGYEEQTSSYKIMKATGMEGSSKDQEKDPAAEPKE